VDSVSDALEYVPPDPVAMLAEREQAKQEAKVKKKKGKGR
jgi:hypothetical protein